MQEEDILDYYNENWNDYNVVVELLHKIIDEHREEIESLQNQLNEKALDNSEQRKIKELEMLLRNCQDKLDEETHKL